MVKTKRLIRFRVWFQKASTMQLRARSRNARNAKRPQDKPAYEPHEPSTMPEVPWHTVAGDFYGPMADGNYWFV